MYRDIQSKYQGYNLDIQGCKPRYKKTQPRYTRIYKDTQPKDQG